MDQGHKLTEKRLKKLEKRLKAEYSAAYENVKAKLEKHLEQFEAEDAQYLAEVNAGHMRMEDYLRWRERAMMETDAFSALRDTLAADLSNANQIAAGIINENTKDVYALNMNYGTYQVENGLHINTSFALYNHAAVENLLKKNPQIVPLAHPDIPKDQLWNRQKITSAVLQGILSGDSIPKIATRLRSVTGMNQAASIRNARTYATAAQNKGRTDSYKRMEDMGIEILQEWLATVDLRTRPSHIALDGMKIKVGEAFPNGCRFPGDSRGNPGGKVPIPGEYYNCRCTLQPYFPKHEYHDDGRFMRLPDDMTFEDWQKRGRKTWKSE